MPITGRLPNAKESGNARSTQGEPILRDADMTARGERCVLSFWARIRSAQSLGANFRPQMSIIFLLCAIDRICGSSGPI